MVTFLLNICEQQILMELLEVMDHDCYLHQLLTHSYYLATTIMCYEADQLAEDKIEMLQFKGLTQL
jgi:hypothetical protein